MLVQHDLTCAVAVVAVVVVVVVAVADDDVDVVADVLVNVMIY
jgi:hypothetical protein